MIPQNESHPDSFIGMSNSDPTYKKYRQQFRDCWESGLVRIRDCAIILNDIINYLKNNTRLTKKEVVQDFYIDNCDLEGINTNRLNYLLKIYEPISYCNKKGS